MGLDSASVMFLCAAKALGADFTRTAMIGRQSLSAEPRVLRRVFSTLGINLAAEDFLRQNQYGEAFFSLLGAQTVASLDFSPYENADIIHDMNSPLPNELRERFSVVHDGGTIEHVFNIPQALKNCMEMVEIGGHLTQVNVANNYMGHGFWQLSPELIFRVFSPVNGYHVEAMFLHEVVSDGNWYVVTDPDTVQSRVELCNALPTYILTVAKRIARADIFAIPPQQSDYVERWRSAASHVQRDAFDGMKGNGDSKAVEKTAGPVYLRDPVKRALKRFLHFPILNAAFNVRHAFARPYFRRIDEDALLHGNVAPRG